MPNMNSVHLNTIVKNDIILKMTPEKRRKIFHNQAKASLLSQHPEKPLDQNDKSR